LLGPVVAEAIDALEPAPTHPDAAEPLVAVVVGYVLLVSWLGAAVAGLARRPVALAWAAGSAAVYVGVVVACPTSGHHASVGAWWYGELGLSLGALVGCLAALRWWVGRPTAGT